MAGLTNAEMGHRTNVKKSKDTKVLQMLRVSTASAVLRQTTTTSEETWVGLTFATANNLCVASEQSVLNSTTRDYLGAAKITLSSGGTSVWTTIENCWGTKVTTQIARMGDTNLYQVSRTTVEMDISLTGGTLQKL